MGFAPLPLGYSYVVGQGFAHAAAPPMAYVYPGTQMGMPPADYEAAIRGLTPEGKDWGPSQINALFTYLSNNAPLRTDEERTDPSRFACTYEAEQRVTKERVVYFLAPDGPADNPQNWKKACQVLGYSETLGGWIFPQSGRTDITIWYQSGAGESYDYSVNIGEWFRANWQMISATIAVVASIVVSVATLGGASATVVGAIALVGACASAAPKLADGYKNGNYREMLEAVQEIGRAAAPLGKALAEKIAKDDPKFATWAGNVAASVSKVYEGAKSAGTSIENLANQALKLASTLPPLAPEAQSLMRETIGPVGSVFWDAASKIPLKDLPNFAATQIPWYAQGVIQLQATLRGIEEAQQAEQAARIASQTRQAITATPAAARTVRIATAAAPIQRTVIPSKLSTQTAAPNAPTTNAPGQSKSATSQTPILIAGVAAVAIAGYALTRKGR